MLPGFWHVFIQVDYVEIPAISTHKIIGIVGFKSHRSTTKHQVGLDTS